MECTACGENCPFVKSKLCSSEKECPNYVESWWQENGQGQPKIIRDCAPKRVLIQQQIEVNRMFAIQQSIEQMRNSLDALNSILTQLMNQSKNYILENVESTDLHITDQTQKTQRQKKMKCCGSADNSVKKKP